MKANLYSKLPLSLKIIVPFLVVFVGVSLVTTYTVKSLFFSSTGEALKNDVENLANLANRDWQQREQTLLSQALLLADSQTVINSLKRKDKAALEKELTELKNKLKWDFIKVVNSQGATITEVRKEVIKNASFGNKRWLNLFKNKETSLILKVEGKPQALMVSFAPIQSKQGLAGGIILGKLIEDEQLEEINLQTKHQNFFVMFYEGEILAANLPDARVAKWQVPSVEKPPLDLTILRRNYMAKSIALRGSEEKLLMVALRPKAPVEQTLIIMSKRLDSYFWIGVILATFVGIIVARNVASPITNLTLSVRCLATGNFNTKVRLTTGDEVGELGEAFNSMVEKLAERDKKISLNLHQLQQTLHDLKQAQSQLIQAEKMSSLGQMVAGIAHEINNPVNFIYGNISHASEYIKDLLELIALYQKEYENPNLAVAERLEEIDIDFVITDLQKLLASMKMGAERIQEIVKSLRNFSRLDEAEMKQVDLHEGLESTLLILNNRIKQKIRVVREYGNLPLVECYPAQLNQVFMNLISNAIDAVIECDKLKEKEIAIRTEKFSNNQVRVIIRDNGPGIDQAAKDKLFDPFFTTKPVGKGTGLGLSISYQIIEKHGGNIRVTSSSRSGAEFWVEIPIKHTKLNAFANTDQTVGKQVTVSELS